MCCTKGAWTFVISGYLDEEIQSQLEIEVKKSFLSCSKPEYFLCVFILRKIRCLALSL